MAVFLVAQLVVTPVMGGGVFSGGDMLLILGSLMGQLLYGRLSGPCTGCRKAGSRSTAWACIPKGPADLSRATGTSSAPARTNAV